MVYKSTSSRQRRPSQTVMVIHRERQTTEMHIQREILEKTKRDVISYVRVEGVI